MARGCAALAAAALLATGCSSSKSSSSGASGSPTTSSPTTTSAPTTAAPTTSASGAGPTDTAAATQAVTQMWEKYYDSTVDPSQKAALVQNPAKVQGLLQALLAASKGGKSSAKVTAVTFTSATEANVVFDIMLNGATAVSGVNGKAIYDSASGNWQVSDQTLCQLAALASVPAATLSSAGC